MKKILIALFCVFFVSLFASVAFASSDVDQVVTNSSVNQDIFVSVDLGRDYDFNCNESVIDNETVIAGEPVVDSDLSRENTSSELNTAFMVDSNVSSSALMSGDSYDDIYKKVHDDAAKLLKRINMTKEEFKQYFAKNGFSLGNLNMTMKEYINLVAILAKDEFDETHSKKNIPDNKSGSKLDIKGPNLYNINPKGPNYKKLLDAARKIKGPKSNNPQDEYVDEVFEFAVVFLQHPEWYIVDYLAYVGKFYMDPGYVCSLIADAHNFAFRNYGGPGHMAINEVIAPLMVYTYMQIYWRA